MRRANEFLRGTVAVGAEEPLAEHMMVADFFRKFSSIDVEAKGKANENSVDGIDGLGGIHHSVSCFISISSSMIRILTYI